MILFPRMILTMWALIFTLPEVRMGERMARSPQINFPQRGFSVHSTSTFRDSKSSTTGTQDQGVPISFQWQTSFRTKVAPKCQADDGQVIFCEEDSEYDEIAKKRFDELMRNSPISNSIIDVLHEDIRPDLRIHHGLSSETTLCDSTETIIYPKRGKTRDDEWVFILNQGSMKQGIKVEKCLTHNNNRHCRLGRGGELQMTFCRQKYIYKKLLTMDTSGKNIVPESLFLPSCCLCYVSNEFISPKFAQPVKTKK